MFDSHDLPPVLPNAPEWLQERMEYSIRKLYHLKRSLQAEPPPVGQPPSRPPKPYGSRPGGSHRAF